MRALASPASLKGVLSATRAAAALARGLREAGATAVELPVADGGEGTAEVLHAALGGEWRDSTVSDPLGRPVSARWLLLPDGRAVVEAAEAIGLPLLAPEERDPLRASSRGLGELVLSALAESPASLFIALGGTATVDGGAGLREVLTALPVPAVALYDVRIPLADAPRLFGPQKGASPADVAILEGRLAAIDELLPYAALPGAGAAGGLGAAFAALGAELVPGASAVLDLLGFDEAARRVGPGRDRRGSRGRDDSGGQGAERGRGALRRGRYPLCRLRRPGLGRGPGRRDGRALGRAGDSPSATWSSSGVSSRSGEGEASLAPTRFRPCELRRRRAGRPSPRAASRRRAGAPRRTGGTRTRAARRSSGSSSQSRSRSADGGR